MTFTSIPNGVRIAHLGTIGTVEVVNTVGAINGSGGAVGDDMSVLAKSHGDAWRQWFVPNLNVAYKHYATLCYSLEDPSLAAGDAGYTSAIAGTISTAIAPLQVACCISLKTAKRGRTYQGRMFIGGLSQSQLGTDGRTFGANFVTTMGQCITGYKDAVDPALNANGAMAVCSKGSPARQIAPHAEPVTGVIVRPAIATQRRRLA